MDTTSEDISLPTDEEARLLRHMLGIDKPYEKDPEAYRNYAAVSPGGEQHETFRRMQEKGLVNLCHEAGEVYSEFDLWRCTDAGRKAARKSQREIRASKPERKYHKYLDLTDSFPNLTFRKFLTDPFFEDAREAA